MSQSSADRRQMTRDRVHEDVDSVSDGDEPMKRWMIVLACLFSVTGAVVPQSSAADAPAIVVGRVYHIEGDLLRYVPEENDWVAVVTDAPFGADDALYSGSRGMAELIAPNGTWIRIGNGTQIQFIALDADLSEADVASGMARFSNRSSDTAHQGHQPVRVRPGRSRNGLRLHRRR